VSRIKFDRLFVKAKVRPTVIQTVDYRLQTSDYNGKRPENTKKIRARQLTDELAPGVQRRRRSCEQSPEDRFFKEKPGV